MKKTTLFLAIVAPAALIVAPIAWAQHHHMRAESDFGGTTMFRLERAKRALGLTDDQVAQLKTIREELKVQNQPYRDSLRSARRSILQTLLANPNDVAAAQALVDQQTAAETAMKKNVLAAASKGLNVLTPEQRGKLGSFVQERMARHAPVN